MKTWLITGCSSGLGKAIAATALARGDKVAATARNPSDLDGLTAAYPDTALSLHLDVTEPASITASVAKVEAEFDNIDVLVNNAGYGYYGAIEEVTDEQALRLIETNVLGTIRVAREVLPGMRARRSGTIVNVGSISGIVGGPGNGYYSATKFAVEGLSEALRAEIAPLGIRVILLEPSGIRTDFHDRSFRRAEARISDYNLTAGTQIETYLSSAGKQAGDPGKIARMLAGLIDESDPPFRMLIGNDAIDRARGCYSERLESAMRWEALSRSTDFGAE